MPLMMLLTSCGEGGSFLRVNNSLGLASFIGVGLLVGACLGFIYAIMPRIDTVSYTHLCQRRLRMRNKRTDTCHIYRQIPQKQQIFGYAFNTLSRKPYHCLLYTS